MLHVPDVSPPRSSVRPDPAPASSQPDPQRSAAYRAQFEEVQELKQIYSEPEFVKQRILASLKLYFGLGLGIAVLLSVALAALLSRQIARSAA